jgi:hypothetical protein
LDVASPDRHSERMLLVRVGLLIVVAVSLTGCYPSTTLMEEPASKQQVTCTDTSGETRGGCVARYSAQGWRELYTTSPVLHISGL